MNLIKRKKIKFNFVLLSLFVTIFFYKKNIKVAICTMGKDENLYVKEFISYYYKLGIDKIFIYDNNDLNSEKISDMIDTRYKNFVKIYDTKTLKIFNQPQAFTDCYEKFKSKFDWILMIDIDEYLYIKRDKLKNYLLNPVFQKCDFIKFQWVIPTDNNHLYYENKSLFTRFKGPYKISKFFKSIIRGNIPNLKYWIHSPYISPYRNISCNNMGTKIYNKILNFEFINNKNIQKAFIIHFKYKSTEEFIKKIKRGYRNWYKGWGYSNYFGNKISVALKNTIIDYLTDNKLTKEKLEYLEKELNINLNKYKKNCK